MRTLPTLFCLLFLLISPAVANAQVVINEFSAKSDPEWIELYNSGSESISIDQWMLKDSNTKTSDDITLTGNIKAGEYLIINHDKGWLNDSGTEDIIDTITLTNSEAELIDIASYGSAKAGKTTSRIPNISGDFVDNTEPTPGEANQTPPTPTPTPDPSPDPTQEPTPTPTPTPESTLASTSYKITTTPTPRGEIAGASDSAEINLATFTIDSSPSPEPEEVEEEKSKTPLALAGAGLTFTAAGGAYFYQQKKKKPKINLPD